jgi:hypothetical protein
VSFSDATIVADAHGLQLLQGIGFLFYSIVRGISPTNCSGLLAPLCAFL